MPGICAGRLQQGRATDWNDQGVPNTNSSLVSVRRVAEVRARLSEQSLAWARDSASGALRYILELGAHQRGMACGCTCISCGQPLLSINAARSEAEVRQRPHFRHLKVTTAASCLVQTARAALLSSLQEGELIVLPRLRHMAMVRGLSGATYEGWFELTPQPVRINKLRFSDATTAEIVLDDGRRLRVVVIGSADRNPESQETMVPRIEICIDDPEVAALPLDKLRSLLVPALAEGIWCGRWPDLEGEAQALAQARAAAGDALDWTDEEASLPADLRRESLLHREVKAILATAENILMPAWRIAEGGDIVTESARRVSFDVAGARLEKKLGRIIPDVIADLKNGTELLVEVTVANTITEERLDRIRAVNLATVEIDFSRMAGALSRDALRHLVIDDVVGKRWLHHPAAVRQANSLLAPYETKKLELGPKVERNVPAFHARLLQSPAEVWAEHFLRAVRQLANIDIDLKKATRPERELAKAEAQADMLYAADALHLRGYPDALDYRLLHLAPTVLHRLMSIMFREPVGYDYDTVWQVINTMLANTTPDAKSWHGLYLMAIKVRGGELGFTQKQNARIATWRDTVLKSIGEGSEEYLRDPLFDRLFGLLFPELAAGLANARFKRVSSRLPLASEGSDPDLDDQRFYESERLDQWTWSMPSDVRARKLEIAASSARLDGWAVDDTSILHHLVNNKFAYSNPSGMAVNIGEKLAVGPAPVLRYLRRNGYIVLMTEASGERHF